MAHCWMSLSRTCRAAGKFGLTNDEVCGLVEGRVGDANTAILAAVEATELQPSSAEAWSELGRSATLHGKVDVARSAFDQATKLRPLLAEGWYERARVEAASAAERGFFTRDEFRLHRRYTNRALSLDPSHTNARYHSVRVAIRAADWSTALEAAAGSATVPGSIVDLFSGTPSIPAIGCSGDKVDKISQQTAPPEVWLVAFWRLLDLGAISQAFEAKDQYARALVEQSSSPDTPREIVTRARALVQLNDSDRAMREISEILNGHPGSRLARTLTKMQADIRLMKGDATDHQLTEAPRILGPAEHYFRELIDGSTVAIVGPTTSSGVSAQLEDFEIVIRQKSLGRYAYGSDQTAHTDISYFANASAQILQHPIRKALEHNQLSMAVMRPTAFDHLGESLASRPDVRFAPNEFGLFLEATSYAVPRIAYDVLRYRPSRVTIFNTNFFTDGLAYDAGYQVEKDVGSDHKFRELVAGYGHDLKGDHLLMSNLLHTGLIEASDEVQRILTLSSADYLAIVGSALRDSAIT